MSAARHLSTIPFHAITSLSWHPHSATLTEVIVVFTQSVQCHAVLCPCPLLHVTVYQAIFLARTSASELVEKLCAKFNFEPSTIHSIAR